MDITELLTTAAIDNALSLGLLVAAVYWFSKRDKEKDATILTLHGENKTFLKEELEKSRETINNNTIAMNAFRDALKK